MADGYLNFDTRINESGFNKGISNLSKIATTGLGVAVGNAITKVVDKVGSIGTAAVKVGMNFEAEMSKVSAISGATGEDFQKLTDKAKEMGAKTKFSATESAQAMEYMAMAGWKTQDMVDGLKGIMDLAAASGEDLATTSDIVTDALTAFGLKASDSTHFADVLAKASSNANTNVAMMGETFKYVAPVAGALGYSVEDCSVAIGLMANSGIKASQAGTSLRQMLSRLAKPTDEVQGAMDQLGVSLTDSAGNMKSLDTVMGDLRNGFKGLSKAEQAQLATSLAGQEAMSGLLAIVNASDGDFDKLKDSIYNCKDAAANMAAVAQDNLAGQITSLKSKAEGLGIAFYGSIQEPLKELASVGVKALEDLNNAYASNGFVGFINEIGNKVPLLQGFTDAIAGLAEKTKGMSTEELMNLGKTAAVLAGAAPALSVLGKSAGTCGDILSGLGEISGGTLAKLNKMPGDIKKLGGKMKAGAKTLSTAKDALWIPFEGMEEQISGALGKITYHVKYYGAGIQNQISKLGAPVTNAVSKFTAPIRKLGSVIGGSLGKVGTQISGYASIIGNAFAPILSSVAGFIPSFISLLNFGAVAAVVVAGLGLLYSQFGTQIDQLLLLAQTKGPEIISNLGNGITAAIPGLMEQGKPGYLLIEAVPVVDYSKKLELSKDMQLNYTMDDKRNGVNHLIVAGKGELQERNVFHLYVQKNGSIGKEKYYTGLDEITEVYENTSTETDELEKNAIERLQDRMNKKTFKMDVASLGLKVGIGDIVGGRDYLTGMYMSKPVKNIIYEITNDVESITYKLEGEDEE